MEQEFQAGTKKRMEYMSRWRKPSECYLMVNFDDSYDEDNGRGSIGVIIRDSFGRHGCSDKHLYSSPDRRPDGGSVCSKGRIDVSPTYWRQSSYWPIYLIVWTCLKLWGMMGSRLTHQLQYMMGATLYGPDSKRFLSSIQAAGEANQGTHA